MKIDDIYIKCAQYCQMELPASVNANNSSEILALQSKVRSGLAFCGQFGTLAQQKLAEAKNKLAAAKSLAAENTIQSLKSGLYSDTIKNAQERRFLIMTESNNKVKMFEVEAEVDKFKHLYSALRDAYNNLIALKEQLSSIIGLLRTEADLASKGGAYNLSQDLMDEIKF